MVILGLDIYWAKDWICSFFKHDWFKKICIYTYSYKSILHITITTLGTYTTTFIAEVPIGNLGNKINKELSQSPCLPPSVHPWLSTHTPVRPG